FANMAKTRDEFAEKERALLIHAADVICSLDADGIITDVSPACRKIWGFEPLELLSLRLQEIVFPEDISSTTEHIEQAKKLTESSFENRIKRKDGGLVDMLWSVKWSPADSSFFCVAHDNTERKSAERMKADFVAMLSHDLRSPLNSVQAFFTMVGDKVYGALSDKGMAKVAMLESTVSWLIELISNLLDIDKIEAGLAELELRQVSIKELVGKAHAALEALAEKRNVLVELPDIDATINADSDMFLRVITNLLSNAIKFAPENSRVKVEIENVDGFVEMRIVDAGKGIAPENQQAIFERFRQVRGEGDNKTRSSGLGLAVAKVIVEQHKGTIGVRSALGQGSTFWVRLPAAARGEDSA
ncbi:MAG TPA: ATP-binding protein, partial [Candidatus Melainabacteria bacterium]|nr:ATP-binding protein [Candidatus Melainabacteria bacterium]